MSNIKFHHVFASLLVLSALSAFVFPTVADPVRGVQSIFAPVSRPIGAIARWTKHRVAPDISADKRAPVEVRQENEELRTIVSELTRQLEILKQVNADRASLGKVRELCTPVRVAGADSGPRESLLLTGTTGEGLRTGQRVIYREGIVGQLSRAGPLGAQLRLITDNGFTV